MSLFKGKHPREGDKLKREKLEETKKVVPPKGMLSREGNKVKQAKLGETKKAVPPQGMLSREGDKVKREKWEETKKVLPPKGVLSRERDKIKREKLEKMKRFVQQEGKLYREGDKLKQGGTGELVQLFIVEQFGFSHYPNGEILKFIDAVANNGGNGIRVFGFFPMGKGREEEPYVRVGSSFDLNRFNTAFFDYLQKWMKHAQSRGLVVLYELFDSVGLKSSDYAEYHPFGQFTAGNLQAFSDLSNQRLVTHQKGYLNQVVNLLKQYPNVIFGIMNEYAGDKNWHYEMSKHVKTLAPQHLVAGSAHDSPATGDPNVDMWFIHTASYDLSSCRSSVGKDVAEIRPRVGNKIVGYSTDGFGTRGVNCENPQAMSNLAKDIKANNLQIFGFLDHKAYVTRDDSGKEYPLGTRDDHIYVTAQADRANTETYRAISGAFPATPLSTKPVELPKGFLSVFDATLLNYTHPHAFIEKGGRGVTATRTQGYLCYGQYDTGYPVKPLEVYFSIFIDNNSYDDALILVLDVYDSAQDKVLTNWAVTRKQFPQAQAFNLLKLSFTPTSKSKLEFRVYYIGFAYIVVDKMAIIEPDVVQLKEPSEIPDVHQSRGPSPGVPVIPPIPPSPGETPKEGFIDIFDVTRLPATHPNVFIDFQRGGRAIKATTIPGFLCYGQYVTGYPTKLLEVGFSIYIDNNMADDVRILALDVYDSAQNSVLANTTLTRKQFPKAGAFNLFKLSFTPAGNSKLEFRIYYLGFAYIVADKIAVVDPEKAKLEKPEDIPDPNNAGSGTGSILIKESLKDGKSVGQINDGTWTAEGVRLRGGRSYISYKIPTTPRGFIEFSARGFVQDELHGGSEYKAVLLSMWDDKAGFDYENAPYIFELRKYGFIAGRPDASNTLWFKIKSNGEWTENHRYILSWDPSKNYRFRVEWGGGETRAFRDGQLAAKGSYRAEFAPPVHKIQIGANPRRDGPHNLLISDVVIGKL